jgi:hypothetical protein
MAPPLVVTLLLTAGQMAAQFILMPRTKQQAIDTGKFDDIRITGSEYGAFIPRIFGMARVGGNVIWSSGIKHTMYNFPSVGGKGIPQAPAERVHVYTTNLGLLLSRGQMVGHKRIWADADIVNGETSPYQASFEAENLTLSGTATILDPDTTASGGKSVTGLGKISTSPEGKAYIDLNANVPTPQTPDDSDPDAEYFAFTNVVLAVKSDGVKQFLLRLDTGTPSVTINRVVTPSDTGGEWVLFNLRFNGFPSDLEIGNPDAPAPDLDFIRVTRYFQLRNIGGNRLVNQVSGFSDPNYKVDSASDDASAGFDYVPSAEADGSLVGSLPGYADLRLYTGTSNQTVNTAFVAYLKNKYGEDKGESYAMAYRDLCLIVWNDLNLKQGRVPNFTIELFNNLNKVNDILGTFLEDVGIGSSQYDLTETVDIEGNPYSFRLIGFVETQRASRRGLIESLERYFTFRVVEQDGKIKTIKDGYLDRSNATFIPASDLRAVSSGENPATDYSLVLSNENEVPREVRFSVMNPELDYHNETVSASLIDGVSSLESMEFTFPIVDSSDNARNRAENFLLKMHSEKQAIQFQAMPKQMIHTVGDNIALMINGESKRIKITKKRAELPLGVVFFEGVILDSYIPSNIIAPVTASRPLALDQVAVVGYPRFGYVVPIISKPIREVDRGKLGVYVAVCNRGIGKSDNTGLYREFGSENFVIRDFFDQPSTVGVVEGTLSSHSDAEVEDTTNTVTLSFYNPTSLESVTGADLVRYPALNLLRIGNEWVQFRTAVKLEADPASQYPSKWEVSNLSRGRFDTADAMAGHTAGEDVVLATNMLKFLDLDRADVGETVTLKAVAGGQILDDAQAVSFEFNPLTDYDLANFNPDRALDADCTTIDELADVISTVIKDVKL